MCRESRIYCGNNKNVRSHRCCQLVCFVCVCCRFDDFDDAIDEAIEEDIGDLCGGERTM